MEQRQELVLSPLGHTWLIDLDGTLVKHNGYKTDGEDIFLEGAKDFLLSIPSEDILIILTSRTETEKKATETFLKRNGVRYSQIIYGLPYGERILLNDRKESGLETAVAVNLSRDVFDIKNIIIDAKL